MTLQNRVDPFGQIAANPARGTFMGNRGGCFHDENRQLTRARWASRQWITCVLEFRDRRRKIMQPRVYTELFFLDEATSLAAGHRPCFECRRADANAFFEALRRGLPELARPGERLSVDTVDRRLHEERVDAKSKTQRTMRAQLSDLPDGVMVTRDAASGRPLLLRAGQLYPWAFEGYASPTKAPSGETVTVLTPLTTVAALRAGYEPAVHPSASG